MERTIHPPASSRSPRWREIFLAFLKLGCMAFGGPVAHLGYFRDEFVQNRRWLSDAAYAELVALCQFLPGPASSKVGFLLGVVRGGGLAGGVLAWLGFTLPSALIMIVFAGFAASLGGPAAEGAIHGLKLVAVAVVAHAVWGMAQRLTPDTRRRAIALGSMALGWSVGGVVGGVVGQLAAILAGAAAGWCLCRGGDAKQEEEPNAGLPPLPIPIRKRQGAVALALFALLLGGLPLLVEVVGAVNHGGIALANAFYRPGALVFGGGHVLLPLLEVEVVGRGWISSDAFLAGYGVAQALPGPLFSFAAYLGALSGGAPGGFGMSIGAVIALVAVFLPGMLLAYGALPFWGRLRVFPAMQALIAGANAAVVGILALALYDPVGTKAIQSPADLLIATLGLALLITGRIPVWSLVLLIATGYALLATL